MSDAVEALQELALSTQKSVNALQSQLADTIIVVSNQSRTIEALEAELNSVRSQMIQRTSFYNEKMRQSV